MSSYVHDDEFVGRKPQKRSKLGALFKMRNCLNPECKRPFLSSHAGNRFCSKCRQLESSPGDDIHTIAI